MHVWLYILKVQREFVEDTGNRHIVRVHQFGTPKSKWLGVGSLVELHHDIHSAFDAFEWTEVENALENKCGFDMKKDIEEFSFHQLFAKWN